MATKRKGTHDGHNQSEIEPLQFDGKKRGGFCNFLYDKQTGLVMGRKGIEWCQLIGFYILLYTFLIGFWAAYLYGFMTTINDKVPSLTGYQSMLKLNPAVGYRPQIDYESNLIKFTASKPETYAAYVKDSNDFLKPYMDEAIQNSLYDCTDDVRANKTVACKFNPLETAPDCFNAQDNTLGFSTGQPCVILKMNRIYGWIPDYKPNTAEYIDRIRIRCIGENDADNETLGEISYFPGGKDVNGTFGYFPTYYFPFMNQKNYLSPLVFAQFKNVKPFTIALIWCELEAEDMKIGDTPFYVNRALNDRAGGVHFELVVDK